MRNFVECLRMLGFLTVLAAVCALIAAGGCERDETLLEIETPDSHIEVKKQKSANGVDVQVEDC